MLEGVGAGVEKVFCQAIEHEGVVGVGGMAEAKELFFHRFDGE
jgi:hypothetical protein